MVIVERRGRRMAADVAWTISMPWRRHRFGFVLMPGGWVFVGFFEVLP